ncbi:MAG TPA: hypothetical protein VMT19_10700 [Thermoanaerobaculaceae bacterium]|nr:hypothetical protein [Thermoanaerobaculaceae bacterium]
MKRFAVLALVIAAIPAVAAAGEIYGTITEQGKPVKDGLAVTISCGEKTVKGATDKNGAYRLFAEEEGKCTLTVKVGEETPSTVVHSFSDSARYNLILEKKDGKYILRSE